jgi:prepilin-type N-terminal cleavage/methylation domain-containing protein
MVKTDSKGFTLIELLVVIAIVAILAVVVILTLNPAELLKQARDSNRISDLNTLKSAISVYLADVSTPSIGTVGSCYTSANTFPAVLANCGWSGSYTQVTTTAAAIRNVDGTGWIKTNLTQISSGAPISQLPTDPVNSGQFVYRFAAVSSSTNGFGLMASLESSKYTSSTSIAANDGGVSTTAYEAGTVLNL